MNIGAWTGFIVGATILVYFIRMIFLFMFKKVMGLNDDRKSKNVSLIMSVIFCTLLYSLLEGELTVAYVVGGIILYSLGQIKTSKAEVQDAGKKI